MAIHKYLPEGLRKYFIKEGIQKFPTWEEIQEQICKKLPSPEESLSDILGNRNAFNSLKEEYLACTAYLSGEKSGEYITLFYFQLINFKQPKLFKTQSYVLASAHLRGILGIDLSSIKKNLNN